MGFVLNNFTTLTDKRGRSLLHHACYSGNIKSVEYLLSINADLNKMDIYGKSPLCTAIYKDNIDVSKLLIENGSNIDKIDTLGRTRLHRFACKGNFKKVELLLDLGADINKFDFIGKTALHHASYSNNYNNFIFLLKRKANKHSVDYFSRNVLFYNIFGINNSVNSNDHRIIDWCLKNLRNNYKYDSNGFGIMFYALISDNRKIISKLFFNGFNNFDITTFDLKSINVCRSIDVAEFLLLMGHNIKDFNRFQHYGIKKNEILCNYIEDWENIHKHKLINKINIIRNWWIDIYYSPYHPIGKRRLVKSYNELFK